MTPKSPEELSESMSFTEKEIDDVIESTIRAVKNQPDGDFDFSWVRPQLLAFAEAAIKEVMPELQSGYHESTDEIMANWETLKSKLISS
jgi:hypothetical protein